MTQSSVWQISRKWMQMNTIVPGYIIIITLVSTLSMCASSPSWLLCLVVSRTKSLAWLAICSNREPCEPCRRTPFPVLVLVLELLPPLFCRCTKLPSFCFGEIGDPADVWRWSWIVVIEASWWSETALICRGRRGPPVVLKLEALARTLPTLGWRCRPGPVGGTWKKTREHSRLFSRKNIFSKKSNTRVFLPHITGKFLYCQYERECKSIVKYMYNIS